MDSKKLENALVMPVGSDLTGGVFNKGVVVNSSLGPRIYRSTTPATGKQSNVEQINFVTKTKLKAAHPTKHTSVIDEPVILGGFIYTHFGHFILEGITTMWFAKQNPTMPIVWFGDTNLQKWHRDILQIINVHNPHIHISEPTLCKQLSIPDRGYYYNAALPTSEHMEAIATVQWRPIAHKYLWLSRSKLMKNSGKILNEYALEHTLQSLGWTIFHPQEHSIQQQIKILSSAERIAGFEGSAFHSLIFVKDCKARIDIFSRDEKLDIQYDQLAKAYDWSQYSHTVHGKIFSQYTFDKNKGIPDSRKDRFSDYIIPNFSSMLRMLGIDRPSVHKRISPSSTIINTVASITAGETYLEIGVQNGHTFLNVDMKHKTAVDPAFKFNIDLEINEQTEFHEMESDLFFTHLDTKKEYDLIYLDGLHVFEQTLRDLQNCLHFTHQDSIIIIDDTIPMDATSTIRAQNECMELRRSMGDQSRAWHGDVFKVIFAIHDQFPLLSFATITDCANPKTLVWKKPRRGFTPLFETLGDISNMTYDDFVRMYEHINPMLLTEAVKRIQDDLTIK